MEVRGTDFLAKELFPAKSFPVNNRIELGYPERCHNHCFNFNCFRLHLIVLGCLPFEKIELVFHFERNEVIFHFEKNIDRLLF